MDANQEQKEEPASVALDKPSLGSKATMSETNTSSDEKIRPDLDAETEASTTKDQIGMDTSDFITGIPLVITLFALIFIMFCFSMEMTIISTAIPRITDEFRSLKDIGWYGSVYFMCIAAWQPFWGKALKYFPLNIVFAVSAVGFNIGCVVCAVAQNSQTLIVGRAVQGALGAGVPPGIYTIIAFVAPPKLKPMYMGALAAVFGMSSALGPVLGGVLTDHASWRWVFCHLSQRFTVLSLFHIESLTNIFYRINLPVTLPAIVAILIFFKPPAAATPPKATSKEKLLQMDLPGTFVIMGAVICYLLAMQDGGSVKAWNSAYIIGLLVGFGLLLLTFAGVQYASGERAVFRGRIVKDRTLMVMCAIAFFIVGGFQLLLYYLPIYFQSTRDVSAARSGTNLLPFVLTASIFAIICGGIMTMWGKYVPVLLLGSVPSAIGVGLLYTLDIHTSTSKWVGYQLLAGTGIGLVLQIPVMVAQSIVAVSDISTITAIILWCQTMGGAIWVSAGQAGFTNKLLERLPVLAPHVDPLTVLAIGASEIGDNFRGEDLTGVLEAYMDGLKIPFLISVICLCMVAPLSPLARWGSIKGKIPI